MGQPSRNVEEGQHPLEKLDPVEVVRPGGKLRKIGKQQAQAVQPAVKSKGHKDADDPVHDEPRGLLPALFLQVEQAEKGRVELEPGGHGNEHEGQLPQQGAFGIPQLPG